MKASWEWAGGGFGALGAIFGPAFCHKEGLWVVRENATHYGLFPGSEIGPKGPNPVVRAA